MKSWLYILACVLVPLAWGILSTAALRWIERRARRTSTDSSETQPREPMWYI